VADGANPLRLGCARGCHRVLSWSLRGTPVDLFDPYSQRFTTGGWAPILAYGERKLFSPTLLVVVKGRPSPPYIYLGRAAL
jgi:hypothetical protein